ncbi:hypothetical protein PROPEN_01887 [Proteus penneri ATCC 35198]|nr:hypothetical protein PROPEN_01887 [Proteus penneri ATCC 35198]
MIFPNPLAETVNVSFENQFIGFSAEKDIPPMDEQPLNSKTLVLKHKGNQNLGIIYFSVKLFHHTLK